MKNFDNMLDTAAPIWPTALITLAFALAFLVLWKMRAYRISGVMVIKNDQVGTITKKFARKHLGNGRIIATEGEAGVQAQTLPPGLHFGYWPWQYIAGREKMTVISAGHVGIVTAIDGVPIPPGHILGQHVDCNLFQDGIAFLRNGGQRGPQADILPPGDYRVNPLLFEIKERDALIVPQDMVGIVTTTDGQPLAAGDIAGPTITGHSAFQDADAFLRGGGSRGLQEQVLMAGQYYVNPLFLTVTPVELTAIHIGTVGVVISYVGQDGEDQSGVAFTHGNIVKKGQKGVWCVPLDPGRYPINTRVMRVEPVPTTNTVLNWITGYKESHGLDANLESIDVRSRDGFSFPIEVSQIIHIAATNAPRVIARFGTVKNLVSQVLEPTIDNYFRNAAQDSEFLDFLGGRVKRQAEATVFIRDALANLDIEGVNTLMGDIDPPPALMQTLTDRKIAEQQKVTFATQRDSQVERQTFELAKSEADTRGQVVQASRSAEVAKLTAQATISKAEGEAKAKTVNAEADAGVLRMIGDATGANKLAIGGAEAEVLRMKVESAGQQNYALMTIMDALSSHSIKLVPDVSVTGSSSDAAGRGNIVDAMLGVLLAKQHDVPPNLRKAAE